MSNYPEKKLSDNRWWEFYFVRYFVGTAIGAIIVLFLATATSPVFTSQGELAAVLHKLKPEKFESGYFVVLGAAGLAFCYIASAPILVLHAVRGSLLKVRSSVSCKLIFLFSGAVLIVAGAQIYALWLAMESGGYPLKLKDFYAGILFLLISTTIFIAQLFLLWLAVYREKNSFEYYDQLVARRASANSAGIQYVESYRHLREHGNAFFIVLLELLLGAALFYSPVSWSFILMLWIFPAAGVWLFGTLLESRNF